MEMSGAPSDSFLGGLFRTASEGNIARRGGWKRAKVKAKPAPKPKVARAPYVVRITNARSGCRAPKQRTRFRADR
jgi:hypothetical protein